MRQDDITAVALKIDQEQRYPILERAVQFHLISTKKIEAHVRCEANFYDTIASSI